MVQILWWVCIIFSTMSLKLWLHQMIWSKRMLYFIGSNGFHFRKYCNQLLIRHPLLPSMPERDMIMQL
jgi:hypothetical protein